MKYNFDEVINRHNTNSLKYDFALQRKRPQDAIPLWVADMDFKTLDEVQNALVNKSKHGIFGYSEPTKEYFDALNTWFKKHHNWDIDTSKVVLACGVVFAIAATIRALTKENDAVLICQPVYYPFEETIKVNNRKLIVSELVNINGRYEVDYEDFEAKIVNNDVKLFVLCNPHNPVGRVWTKDELEKIGDICLKHNVFVISDEIHSDFTYEGNNHTVFCTIKKEFEDNCIVCTAPTKTFNLAGLHISNIYIPNDSVRRKYKLEMDRIGYSQSNIIGIVACQAAYENGDLWLNELKQYLKGNLEFVRNYINTNLPKLKLIEPEGTYLLWIDCKGLELCDYELKELINYKAKVWVDDGYVFGKGGSGYIRINIACPRSILKQALDRIKGVL
ncbi:MAG: pyridoxal phosphate-dependent aminotransferase [Clostridiales bacterium]|nr:pyridoxal phosphate-dependent aminotransferase [Clostridiales bacterium]